MSGLVSVQWTDNEELARLLDGLDSVPCFACGAECPVPEYVLGAVQRGHELTPVGLCQSCSDDAAPLVFHQRREASDE